MYKHFSSGIGDIVPKQGDINQPTDPVSALVAQLQASSKYGGTAESTLRDVALQSLHHYRGKAALKEARRKLHNIVADYLGDPDYEAAAAQIAAVHNDSAALRTVCAQIAEAHTSTRERLRLLDSFYPRLFALTGVPDSILDLACALNPVLIPFMGLPPTTRYEAYDLHRERVGFLNRFFEVVHPAGRAFEGDILVDPPTQQVDVVFIFKEVHRWEQRRSGSSRALLEALQAHWVLVSLPAQNMTGRRDLSDSYRNLFHKVIAGKNWEVIEVHFEDEMVFCVHKT
ncbi:MAG: hypothetical protein IT322_20875 [Anaerolineae bacterium]|nr:hypothetical protein [Anaerolineae bacterium]